MFDLKKPCNNCPFCIGKGERFQLCRERLEEIRRGPAFPCHQTVPETSCGNPTGPQQCYGLMSILMRENEPNQIMQLASRLIGFDLDAISSDQAYRSWHELLQAHCPEEVEA